MKRLLSIVFILMLVFTVTRTFAATTNINFDITVTVLAAAVDISSPESVLNWGGVAALSSTYSQRGTNENEPYIKIQNDGAEIQLGVMQTQPAGWTAIQTGSAGDVMTSDNEYRMSGTFTNFFGSAAAAIAGGLAGGPDDFETLTAASFQNNDIIPVNPAQAWADGDIIFDPANTASNVRGDHVPFDGGTGWVGTRNLRLAFDALTATSNNLGAEQTILVNVAAQVQL